MGKNIMKKILIIMGILFVMSGNVFTNDTGTYFTQVSYSEKKAEKKREKEMKKYVFIEIESDISTAEGESSVMHLAILKDSMKLLKLAKALIFANEKHVKMKVLLAGGQTFNIDGVDFETATIITIVGDKEVRF